MSDSDAGLLLPVVPVDVWCKRYNIDIDREFICDNCGKPEKMTIPFATGGWRGVKAEPHGCPEGFDQLIAVKADPEERER